MVTKVVGLGAGGHAKVLIEILQLDDQYSPGGLVDTSTELHDKRLLGIPILGGDDRLQNLRRMGSLGSSWGLVASETIPQGAGAVVVKDVVPYTVVSGVPARDAAPGSMAC